MPTIEVNSLVAANGCIVPALQFSFPSTMFCSTPYFTSPTGVAVTRAQPRGVIPDIALPVVQCFDITASGSLDRQELGAEAEFSQRTPDCFSAKYGFRFHVHIPCILSGIPLSVPVYDKDAYVGYLRFSRSTQACRVFSARFIPKYRRQYIPKRYGLDVPQIPCELADDISGSIDRVAGAPALHFFVEDCQVQHIQLDVPVTCGLEELRGVQADATVAQAYPRWSFHHQFGPQGRLDIGSLHVLSLDSLVTVYASGLALSLNVENGHHRYRFYGSQRRTGPTGTRGVTGFTGSLHRVYQYDSPLLRGHTGPTGPTGFTGTRGIPGEQVCSCVYERGKRGPSYRGVVQPVGAAACTCFYGGNWAAALDWWYVEGVATVRFAGIANNVLQLQYDYGKYRVQFGQGTHRRLTAVYALDAQKMVGITGTDSSIFCTINRDGIPEGCDVLQMSIYWEEL